jgi:uncharacterized zinc-type alcohol dehydrogenase-like protein
LGLVTEPHQVSQIALFRFKKAIAGSHIGGIKATQELLDLCEKAGIVSDTQLIKAKEINWAWD